MEKPIRSLAKAISWRIVASLTTIFLAFVLTRNLVLSGTIGLSELLLKPFIYFVHERVWNMSNFGREKNSTNK